MRLPGQELPEVNDLKDPARLEWHGVTKVAHYYLSINAMSRPDLPADRQVQVREDRAPYGKRDQE